MNIPEEHIPKTDMQAISRLKKFDNDSETVTEMYITRRSMPNITIAEAYSKVLNDVLEIKLNAVKEFDKREEMSRYWFEIIET